MGLDQSLFTPEGGEAYFRKKYVLHTYFCVHSKTWNDPEDKWAPDETRIDVCDVERLVKISRILLKSTSRTNFIPISRRLMSAYYSSEEDFGDDFIDSLKQVIDQIPPLLELKPKYFLYSAG